MILHFLLDVQDFFFQKKEKIGGRAPRKTTTWRPLKRKKADRQGVYSGPVKENMFCCEVIDEKTKEITIHTVGLEFSIGW